MPAPRSAASTSPRVAHAAFVLTVGLVSAACAAPPPSPAPAPPAPTTNEPTSTIHSPAAASDSAPSSPAAFMAEVERRAQILRETHEPADRDWLEKLLPSEPPPPPLPPAWRIELSAKGGMFGADARTVVRADGSWTRTSSLLGQPSETKQGRLDPQLMPRLAAFVARQTVPPRPKRSSGATPGSRETRSFAMVNDAPDRVVAIHEGSGIRTLRTQLAKDERWEPLHAITAAIEELLVSKRAAAKP